MKVVIIGSGNVATVLGKKIKEAGNSVEQVISKSMPNALKLASFLGARAEVDMAKIYRGAELYIIAVPDDHIEQVARQTNLVAEIVVHTAGSVTKDVLKSASAHYGVMYPLQSLKKELHYIPQVPVIIDGNSEAVKTYLSDFVAGWASQVSIAGDNERLKLHLAAVTVSNFSNHLYTLAENYCREESLRFNILLPLIQETTNRLNSFSPADVQTGPAIRGDAETIRKHLSLLEAYPSCQDLYTLMTKSIINYYSNL